jgi:hypothetical protein
LTAKEYLQQVNDLDRQINIDMQEACRLRSIAEKITATYSPDKVQSSGSASRLEDATLKLLALEDSIIDSIHAKVKKQNEVKAVIGRVRDARQREVLEHRYLLGKKWEQICVDMHYEWRQVHYLHSRALKDVGQIIERLH